jgi:hypothetical protein
MNDINIEGLARPQLQRLFNAYYPSSEQFSPGTGYVKAEFTLGFHPLGNGSVMVSPKDIFWERFYPLNDVKTQGLKGIGTLAHMAILQGVVDIISPEKDTEVIHAPTTKQARINQLEHMGLESGMRLDDYMAQSVAYANRKGFNFKNPFEP